MIREFFFAAITSLGIACSPCMAHEVYLNTECWSPQSIELVESIVRFTEEGDANSAWNRYEILRATDPDAIRIDIDLSDEDYCIVQNCVLSQETLKGILEHWGVRCYEIEQIDLRTYRVRDRISSEDIENLSDFDSRQYEAPMNGHGGSPIGKNMIVEPDWLDHDSMVRKFEAARANANGRRLQRIEKQILPQRGIDSCINSGSR